MADLSPAVGIQGFLFRLWTALGAFPWPNRLPYRFHLWWARLCLDRTERYCDEALDGRRAWWQRFLFCPFWKVTRWGFLPEYLGRINPGGDETHRSRYIIIPLVGNFVWFDKYPCSDPTCDCREDD